VLYNNLAGVVAQKARRLKYVRAASVGQETPADLDYDAHDAAGDERYDEYVVCVIGGD